MLTREIMGVFALGVLWLNSLLVLAVAFKQLGRVRRLAARLREARRAGQLVSGTVIRAERGERFAVRRIQQLGRALTTGEPDAIVFTDGPQSFEVLGGAIETPEGELEVEPTDPVSSEVWHDEARGAEAIGGDAEAFEKAHPDASKYKGFRREIEVEVRVGDPVWVLGERDGDTLRAPDDAHPLLVSMVSPEAWASSRSRLLLGFTGGSFLILCAITALALYPPRFGVVSTIGGALGLAFFLAIQPLGTAVRDRVKTPARRLLNGEWKRPG